MMEIEKYPCSDGNEARARERHWCETLKASLNDRTPIIIKSDCGIKYTMQEIIEQNAQYYKIKNKLE